jgi:glycosyltransferase involved in cell wall biosynthesis
MVRRGEEVVIAFLKNATEVGRSKAYEEIFLSELKAAGVKYFFIGPDAKRRPYRSIRRVRDAAAAFGIDIYHSHLAFGIWFGLGQSVPRFYTHHNIVMRLPRYPYRLLARLIDVQIGISARCAEALEKHSGRPVTLIYNGVNGKKFLAPVRSLPVEGKINLITVGGIIPQKNYSLMLRAIALLPPELRRRVRLRIVGEGPNPADVAVIRALIEELDISDCVELLGNRSDIPELLRQAHVFLMSSSFEGLSIALLEAVSSGLPCVTTDVGGCAEVVEDGRNGLIVPTMAPADFAAAIERILDSGEAYSKLSRGAIERSRLFGLSSAVDGHLSAYRQALGEK